MSDSTDTNNLDNYGVWVKTPPHDAKTQTEPEQTMETDLPDFSDLDMNTENTSITDEPDISEEIGTDAFMQEDTSISDTEVKEIEDTPITEEDPFGNIEDFGTDSTATVVPVETETAAEDALTEETTAPETETAGEETAPEEVEFSADDFLNDSSDFSGGDEELSLDDFMDGGFSDPNPGAAPAASSDDGEISLDDFFDEDTSSKQKEDDITNDEALDIDLSFTEPENEVPTVEDSAESESESSDETSEFDDMFDSIDSNGSDSPVAESSDATESVSMDEFGLEDSGSSETSSDSEEVDLSDFGIDSDAEETAVHQDVQEAKKNQVVDYDLAISDEESTQEAPTVSSVESSSEENTNSISIPENATVVNNSVLDQIMAELSGLKNEINSLKSDFETIKQNGVSCEAPAPAAEPEISEETATTEEPVLSTGIEEKSEETSGFFGSDDEDDTIALSGDELSNIMNTADFTEQEETVVDNSETEEAVTTEDTFESETPVVEETKEEAVPETDFSAESIEESFEPTEETSSTDFADENLSIPEDTPSEESFELPEEPAVETETNDMEDAFENLNETLSDDEINSIAATTTIIEEPEDNSFETPSASEIEPEFTNDNPFGEIEESLDMPETESASELSMDINNDELEEPDFNELENNELESEITIPKVDNIVDESENTEPSIDDMVVESSNVDLMGSVNESELEITGSPEAIEDSAELTEPEVIEEEPVEEVSDDMSLDSLLEDSPSEEVTTESETEEPVIEESEIAEEFSEPETADTVPEVEDVFTEQENTETVNLQEELDPMLRPESDSEVLSDENFDYLKNDENIGKEELISEEVAEETEEPASTDETLEDPFPPIESVQEKQPEAPAVSNAKTFEQRTINSDLKNDIKSVLLYMDQLLENLPEDKIMEFAKSEQFSTYKRLFNELGLS